MSMKTNRAHTYGVWKGRQGGSSTIGYWPDKSGKKTAMTSQKRKGILMRALKRIAQKAKRAA